MIYEIVVKTASIDFGDNYEKSKIAEKGIILIDFLDEKPKTLSIKKMNMKNVLQQKL